MPKIHKLFLHKNKKQKQISLVDKSPDFLPQLKNLLLNKFPTNFLIKNMTTF